MDELAIYKNIKDKNLKDRNIFIGEGRYVVERMVNSHCSILSIVCIPDNKQYFTKLVQDTCPVIAKSKEELSHLTGFKFHRGVLAAAQRPQRRDLAAFLTTLQVRSLQAKTLHTRTLPESTLLIALPSLAEAENIGSIIRSAVAFSFQGILMGPGCIDPFSRKAIRCSMGTLFEIPLISFPDHSSALSTLQHHGFSIIGATLSATGEVKELENFSFPRKSVIVFGHESEGLIHPWDKKCDFYVRIRISSHLDSLNVGVAAGIFLHAINASILD
ncbi:MAG: RNA methyltransferase [Spirochaetales bacterium]|nr:RNA methyltransferase [Spirochaetales bacterium]